MSASREKGNAFFESYALMLLVHLALERKDLRQAAALAQGALRLAHRLGYPHRESQSLEVLAAVAMATGQTNAAAQLLGAESTTRDRLHLADEADIYNVRQPVREAACRAMDERDFMDAQEAGRSLSIIDQSALVDAVVSTA